MIKHWEHTETVEDSIYRELSDHEIPIKPSVTLEPNTAVYVVSESGGKRIEGIYDHSLKGIRKLYKSSAPNRDLRLYIDALNNPNITMMAVDGLMGTGKTKTVVVDLIKRHLSDVNVTDRVDVTSLANVDAHKIVIAKPMVNAGEEEYGFLPGDIIEKIEPTIKNFTQYFDREHQSGFKALQLSGYVEILPLGFVRGMDAENVSIIVDECQNTKELITMATRRANKSRLFFLGDSSPFQIDLPRNTPKKNGLVDLIDLLRGAHYFQYIEMKSLEHIVRSEEVKDVVRRLFKKHGEDPQQW